MLRLPPDPSRLADRRAVGIWLLCLAAMVFGAVVLGGLTRLTGSGLSMVDWRPITGWLPPASPGEWQQVFELYKQTPQFHHVNFDMDVEAFKSIFWLEFIHRLWGRLIGVAFAVPFLWFLLRGRIERPLIGPIALAFVLGGLQGVIGWLMVASGLVDVPDVSQYRLVAHLGAAILIYIYLLWLGLTLRAGAPAGVAPALRPLARAATAVTALIVLTMLAGGFVAGLDAGLVYNTFPLMDGSLTPDSYLQGPRAAFEDPGTAQFHHRVLAMATLLAVVWLWVKARATAAAPRQMFDLLLGAALAQVGLGIATLLTQVPVALGALHQALAFLVLALAVTTRHGLATPGIRATTAAPSGIAKGRTV